MVRSRNCRVANRADPCPIAEQVVIRPQAVGCCERTQGFTFPLGANFRSEINPFATPDPV